MQNSISTLSATLYLYFTRFSINCDKNILKAMEKIGVHVGSKFLVFKLAAKTITQDIHFNNLVIVS